MKNFRSAAVALLLAACALQAKEPIDWHTAKVISQEMNSEPGGVLAAPIGNMAIAVPISRTSNVIELDTGKYRLRLIENTDGHGPIVLPVNGTVDFYREEKSGRLIILDFKKHKHRFGLLGAVAK